MYLKNFFFFFFFFFYFFFFGKLILKFKIGFIFFFLFRFLYCGKVDLNVKDGFNILGLLVATDELGLNEFNEYIKGFLINNQNEILKILKEEILQKEILQNILAEIL